MEGRHLYMTVVSGCRDKKKKKKLRLFKSHHFNSGFWCEVKAEPMRKLRCIVLCITHGVTINTFSFSASDLPGSTININSGNWIRKDTGVGAGIDSYYEYILKGNFWGHSRFFTVC